MTPGANDLCVFAVKRGYIENKRYDALGVYNRIVLSTEYIYPTELLGNITRSFSGGTPSKSEEGIIRYWNGTIPWVSPKDFKSFYIDDTEDHITEEAITCSATQSVEPNSVLVVVRSGILKHTLPVAINRVRMTINQDVKVLVTNEKVLPEYLGFYLKACENRILKLCVKHSTTVQSVNTKEFFNIEIPIPDLCKQSELVARMNDALLSYQSKRNLANKLLLSHTAIVLNRLGIKFSTSKGKLTYAIRLTSVADRIDADYYSPRFEGFRQQIETTAYPTAAIGDISNRIITGFAAGKQDQANDLPDDQRVAQLRPFSITPEGELSFETKKYVPKDRLKSEDYCQKGEVIFNNTNSPDLVGKTTVFDQDVLCATSNHMTRITVKDGVNPYYVAAFFNVLLSIGYWKLLCTNFNNQAGVNIETLKKVRIPLPDINVQNEIATEIMRRRGQANQLRREAAKEWAEAKAQFERELLGES